MDAAWIGKGLLLGLSVAAPVGPIGVLCIRRTLERGRLHGFVSGLGASAADGAYGLVAGLGLSSVSGFLLAWERPMRALGAVALGALAFASLRSRPAERAADARGRGLAGAFLSTFALTAGNPLTVLFFAAAFAALGLGTRRPSPADALAFVGAVVAGSALWWATLSQLAGWLGDRIAPGRLVWVHRGSGLLLLGFAAAALVGVLS